MMHQLEWRWYLPLAGLQLHMVQQGVPGLLLLLPSVDRLVCDQLKSSKKPQRGSRCRLLLLIQARGAAATKAACWSWAACMHIDQGVHDCEKTMYCVNIRKLEVVLKELDGLLDASSSTLYEVQGLLAVCQVHRCRSRSHR